MTAAIWAGAGQASDVFLLIAAILAGLAALSYFLPAATGDATHPARVYPWGSILLAAAVCCFCVGFLAL